MSCLAILSDLTVNSPESTRNHTVLVPAKAYASDSIGDAHLIRHPIVGRIYARSFIGQDPTVNLFTTTFSARTDAY